jgi:hypothetical protein
MLRAVRRQQHTLFRWRVHAFMRMLCRELTEKELRVKVDAGIGSDNEAT